MDYSEAAKELCLCLNEMEEVFLETENEINCLYTCSPDDIDVCVERIERYREISDEIFAEIEAICAKDESGELKKAVSPRTDRKDVAEDLVCVFEKRQDINAIACRIQNTIPMVQDRLKRSMKKTLEEIKKNNTSQSAQASKYYSAVNDSQESGRLSYRSRTI